MKMRAVCVRDSSTYFTCISSYYAHKDPMTMVVTILLSSVVQKESEAQED